MKLDEYPGPEDGHPDHSPNCAVGRYSEANFHAPSQRCPHPEYWTTADLQGTEVEVIEMVHGLVRGLQPDWVLETGTSRGFMALRIAQALKANDHGTLVTYEPDKPTFDEAYERLAVTGPPVIEMRNEESMQPWKWGPIDFAWFDSLTHLRVPEFLYYYQFMSPRCVVGFHDTSPEYGGWARALWNHADKLQPIGLPTPRGVVLARVVK